MSTMPLQDVLDSAEVADVVLAYCDSLIRVLSGRDDLVVTRRCASPEFNAEVVVEDDRVFTIWLFDGLVERVRTVLDGLESETIEDEMQTLSRSLFGSAKHAHLCYRVWFVESLIF